MSTRAWFRLIASLVLAMGLALGLNAQVRADRPEENGAEAVPVFPGAIPGLGALQQPLASVGTASRAGDEGSAQSPRDNEQLRQMEEIKRLKEKDRQGAIDRFADDLFDTRQFSASTTDGGVAEDYVLGPGDRLQLHVFGGTPMEVPLAVDGRGMLSIPRVGSLKVGGLSLGAAKSAVQALVARNFAQSKAELQVTHLREIRISILGEVYRPGSYLVSSLGSLVNVLSLAGGPTSRGSLREISVMRGGNEVRKLDLYPLRAEGRGNPNFSLESGDVLFVPLARCMVTLEGAFLRLGGSAMQAANPEWAESDVDKRQAESQQGRAATVTRAGAENWFAPGGGEPPRMAFELLPGEGIPAVMNFAGGLLPEWSSGVISVRRVSEAGTVDIRTYSAADPGLGQVAVQRGDVLSALPRRERDENMVSLSGWVRVQGKFARTEGLRIGTLLRRDDQILPDSYLSRGEVVRTLADGTTKYLVFSVEEALKGNPAHDLLLENRDQIRIFPAQSMRIQEYVKVVGPVSHPGRFKLHQGMRASDLVFLAGLPLKSANRLVVELARTGKGLPSTVQRLDLTLLSSDDASSPVSLVDDVRNPTLQPDDQLSFFDKPDFKIHRVVRVTGQVALPGTFVLDEAHFTLSHIIARAGGFTADAMPQAGILLRRLTDGPDAASGRGPDLATEKVNPLTRGVDDILERLSEVKRQPTTGQLLKSPLLHGLAEGRLNRMVVDFPAAATGDAQHDVDLQDGDEIIIPEKTTAAFVVGETASPFGTYKLMPGMKVQDLLNLAGGTTRNADTSNIRLLSANGQIHDRHVKSMVVEPGDTVLVPQVIRRDITWQENLAALTPIALIINAIWK